MKAILLIILILSFGCAKSIKEQPKEKIIAYDQEADLEFGLSPQILLNKQLIQAIITSSSTLVRSAIQRGADANEILINGETALTYSIKNKLDSILFILLTEKVNPNQKNLLDEYPIHLAIEYNDPIAARILLNNDSIDIDILNTNGETPIVNALKSENKRISLMLITRGANLNLNSNTGESTDQLAYNRFDSNFTNLIVKLRLFSRTESLNQALLDIVLQNDTTTLKYIKKIYANKEIQYSLELYTKIIAHNNQSTIEVAIQTMLMTSRYNSYLEHQLLVETIKTDNVDLFKVVYINLTKPNINFVDNFQRTLLTYAVERSDYTMSLNLRKLGADTYIQISEDLVINSCNYLTKKRQSKRRHKAFKEMLGC